MGTLAPERPVGSPRLSRFGKANLFSLVHANAALTRLELRHNELGVPDDAQRSSLAWARNDADASGIAQVNREWIKLSCVGRSSLQQSY